MVSFLRDTPTNTENVAGRRVGRFNAREEGMVAGGRRKSGERSDREKKNSSGGRKAVRRSPETDTETAGVKLFRLVRRGRCRRDRWLAGIPGTRRRPAEGQGEGDRR